MRRPHSQTVNHSLFPNKKGTPVWPGEHKIEIHDKWYFWLERWKNVMRHFIDEVALNLIPSSEAINKTLATILAILIHDCIHKFLKLFYFSRYKPPGLQMTPIQILIPLTGILSKFSLGLFPKPLQVLTKSILMTEVADNSCWWQFWDVGDLFCNQRLETDTNIMFAT